MLFFFLSPNSDGLEVRLEERKGERNRRGKRAKKGRSRILLLLPATEGRMKERRLMGAKGGR